MLRRSHEACLDGRECVRLRPLPCKPRAFLPEAVRPRCARRFITGAQILSKETKSQYVSVIAIFKLSSLMLLLLLPVDAWIIADALQVGINHNDFEIFESGILKYDK